MKGAVVINADAGAERRWHHLQPSVNFAVEFEDGRKGGGSSMHRNGKVETAAYVGAISMGNQPYVYNHRTTSRTVGCNATAFTVAAQRRVDGWYRHSSSTGRQRNPGPAVQGGIKQCTTRVKQRQQCQAHYGWSRNRRMIRSIPVAHSCI